MLAVLIALAPAASVAASPREADTRRDLRDAERQNSEQLAARKDAADRAARAAAKALLLAQEQVEAAAKLRQAETATADLAARIDAWRNKDARRSNGCRSGPRRCSRCCR